MRKITYRDCSIRGCTLIGAVFLLSCVSGPYNGEDAGFLLYSISREYSKNTALCQVEFFSSESNTVFKGGSLYGLSANESPISSYRGRFIIKAKGATVTTADFSRVFIAKLSPGVYQLKTSCTSKFSQVSFEHVPKEQLPPFVIKPNHRAYLGRLNLVGVEELRIGGSSDVQYRITDARVEDVTKAAELGTGVETDPSVWTYLLPEEVDGLD